MGFIASHRPLKDIYSKMVLNIMTFAHQFWKIHLDLRYLSGERPAAMVSATHVAYRRSDPINHKVI